MGLVFEEIELGDAASVLRGIPVEGESRAEMRDAEGQPYQRQGEEEKALAGRQVLLCIRCLRRLAIGA